MRIRPLNDLFLLRLLAPAAVAGLSVLLAVPLLARGREPMPAEDFQRTGVIHGWRLETDGTLYFALQSQGSAASAKAEQDPREASLVWFRSPPEKDVTTRFSELALEVILASSPAGADPLPLTVTAKLERALTGVSPAEALPLIAIARP